MMTKRTRTIIFWAFLVLFVLAAPLIIFYSQGYRLDWQEKRILQTGAFYFKAAPNKADIYLNGKFKKKTSVISGSILLDNLLPKNYAVEIKKEGYQTWKKELKIQERQVIKAENIVLFPNNIIFSIVNKKFEKIPENATSSDKKKLIEKNDYEIWIVFLKDRTAPIERKTGDKIFITRFSEKIGRVFWLNNDYIIFNAGNKIKIAEIDDRDKINIIDLAEFEKPEISWQESEKKLYVSTNSTLYLAENILP